MATDERFHPAGLDLHGDAVAAHKDDRQVRAHGAELTCHIQAIHFRHHKVGDHQIELTRIFANQADGYNR